MNLNIEVGVCGRFQFETFKCDADGVEIPGSRKITAPWFENLITNAGLDRLGVSARWTMFCQVGSGSTPPAFTDTALSSRITSTSSIFTTSKGASASSPYYAWIRTTLRFSAGAAAGNISEVGIGWAATGSLFSRALVVDASGNPTTIQVLPDEYLDVTYEFREYAPVNDFAGVITLAGVDYSYVSRACAVTTWIGSLGGGGIRLQSAVGSSGPIGGVTDSPVGAGMTIPVSNLEYQNGTFQKKATMTAGPTEGNVSGGVGALRLVLGDEIGTSIASYQMGFTPKIPKNANNTLSLTFPFAWARKTL